MLAFVLLFAVAPGCGAVPEPTAAEQLRQYFPAQAAEILDGRAAFAPAGEGFTLRAEEATSPSVVTGLRAILPKTGQEAVALHVGGDDFTIQVRERDGAGDGALAGGAVAYPRRGGTSYWVPRDGGVEEWLMFEAGVVYADKPAATWQIEGATVRNAGKEVEIIDAAGATRMTVTAPRAFVAGGRAITVRLEADGTRISLYADAGGEAALIDPAWTSVTTMVAIRDYAGGTRLSNGNYLVAGGFVGGVSVGTAELYDPTTNTWTATGSFGAARASYAVVTLPSGMALALGGTSGSSLNSAELYDPATGLWTAAAPMVNARSEFDAVVLQSGEVLVPGGSPPVTGAEIYTPATNTWAPAGTLTTGRSNFGLALLSDGKVLIAGGYASAALNTAEIYDPATNLWTVTAAMTTARVAPTATMLSNGKVLLAGGQTATAELFDPTTSTWSSAGSMSVARSEHIATRLLGEKVLVVGGGSATVDLYDPVTNTWTLAVAMSASRNALNGALLWNGKVLAAGGNVGTSELFDEQLPNGAPCAGGSCSSGFCADGVCCNTACKGYCQACNAANTGGVDGTCGYVLEGKTHHGECSGSGFCKSGASCNGAGGCKYVWTGANCDPPASCGGSTVTNARVCTSTGTCIFNGTKNCTPYICVVLASGPGYNVVDCKTSCTVNTECSAGYTCISGKCVLPDGAVCTTAAQCASGNCVDGVCCDTACNAGACDACSLAAGAAIDGVCALFTGPVCNDSNACTQTDACQAGICAGANPVTCLAATPCELDGACDPTSGLCNKPPKPDTTPCPGGVCKTGACFIDGDSDGIPDALDNCPTVDNPTQANQDQDTLGDVCDDDRDGDTVLNTIDNCPIIPNPQQEDVNHDGVGDACDCASPKVNGDPCDDGNLCTPNDTCATGKCQPGAPVTCSAPGLCEDTVCLPYTGACAVFNKVDGAPCPGGVCIAGGCLIEAPPGASASSSGSGSSGGASGSGGMAGTSTSAGTGAGTSASTSSGVATGESVGAGLGGSAGEITLQGGACAIGRSSTNGAPWIGLGFLLALRRRRAAVR